MTLLTKIRGLWRYDSDEEGPVRVSRRRFIFLGACVASGALLPVPDNSITYEWRYLGSVDEGGGIHVATYDSFCTATLQAYAKEIEKNFLEYRPGLTLLIDPSAKPPLPGREFQRAPERGSPEWYRLRHEWKQNRKRAPAW